MRRKGWTAKFNRQHLQKYYGDTIKHGDIEFQIDWEAMIKVLGTKAAFNKSHCATEVSGVIVAKFTQREVVQ
jgi:hypothetical protein